MHTETTIIKAAAKAFPCKEEKLESIELNAFGEQKR
jgi:hypothetical protein